jgi:hypothetical protein
LAPTWISVTADVRLDDRHPAAFFGDDQGARMSDRGLAGRAGEEDQVNDPADGNAFRHVHEGAVLNERRIERREAGGCVVDATSEAG